MCWKKSEPLQGWTEYRLEVGHNPDLQFGVSPIPFSNYGSVRVLTSCSMVGIIILMWRGISQNGLPTMSSRVLLRQYWTALRYSLHSPKILISPNQLLLLGATAVEAFSERGEAEFNSLFNEYVFYYSPGFLRKRVVSDYCTKCPDTDRALVGLQHLQHSTMRTQSLLGMPKEQTPCSLGL